MLQVIHIKCALIPSRYTLHASVKGIQTPTTADSYNRRMAIRHPNLLDHKLQKKSLPIAARARDFPVLEMLPSDRYRAVRFRENLRRYSSRAVLYSFTSIIQIYESEFFMVLLPFFSWVHPHKTFYSSNWTSKQTHAA